MFAGRILSPERMSLKAKIEAVIYAAEEPVTLAQLAGLFDDEALEEKRAREAAAQVVEPQNEVSVVLTTESVEPDDGALPAEAVAQIHEENAAPLTVEEAAVMAAHASEEGVTIVEAVIALEQPAGLRLKTRSARLGSVIARCARNCGGLFPS